ncbi:MAG: low molecular weight phosphotyrosine protein phosphatase [Myxococcales bacterium]|nr:MAG: low molecular weight phosphotyrosine protein phosphatase [Myxococcales bacterium]
MVKLCFVCLGNICRSPIGEGVMRHLLEEAGLGGAVEVCSAGTAGYHRGELPDARARAAGRRFGVEVHGRARQFQSADFARFDYVLAMDASNYQALSDLSPDLDGRRKLHLLRSFDPESPHGASVPDPYYGDDSDFDEVVEICLAACAPLLEKLRREHQL